MVKRLIYLTFLLCVRLMLMAQDISPMATAFLPLDGDSICYEFVEAKNPQESFSGKCTCMGLLFLKISWARKENAICKN